MARATDEKIRRGREGSGGAVTALLISGLGAGDFDAVVATAKKSGIEGQAVVARDRAALLRAAGSRWNLVQNLRLLYRALSSYEVNQAAVVCTPCQAHFLRQAIHFPIVESCDWSGRVALIVGLFCMGTFSQPSFAAFLRDRFGIRPEQVEEVFLQGEHLRVRVKGQATPLEIPVLETGEFVNLGCLVCDDYAACDADLSAGTAPAAPGWTVLIPRTKAGESALRKGVESGALEVSPAPEEVRKQVCAKAEEKLRRAAKYRLLLF